VRDTFRSIAQLLPEPLLLVSCEGVVLAANHAAIERFDWAGPRIEDRPLSDLVDGPWNVADYLSRCARSTAPQAGVLVDRHRGERMRCEGARYPDLGTPAVVLRFSPPERLGAFALLTQKIEALNREILQRREAEAHRERLIDELARAVRLSELFVAVLGHDLRNPLAAVITGTALALRRVDDPHVRGQLERVARSANRMSRMVAQLLDVTRVRLGRGIPLERAGADLADLIRQAIAETEPAFRQHRFDVAVDGPCAGEWDRDRLAQVLSNLLVNACQHSAPGSTVRVRLSSLEAAASVSVHNDGPAIPTELLPTVFDAFSGSSSSHGLGLGLYIAREIVRAHGGELAVDSSDAGGTTFTLTLPRAAAVLTDGHVGLVDRDVKAPAPANASP
jgi:signal transduction histidine kinase